MKVACVALVILLCLAISPASAQQWFAAGAQLNGLTGSGEGENTFSSMAKNPGLRVEYGVKAKGAVLGFALFADWYGAENRVGTSVAKASFIVPIGGEFRYFLRKSGGVMPWIGLGSAWSLMKFEGTKGADNQALILASGGIQFRKGKLLVQAGVQPYLAVSNSLGQSSGLQVSLSIGGLR